MEKIVLDQYILAALQWLHKNRYCKVDMFILPMEQLDLMNRFRSKTTIDKCINQGLVYNKDGFYKLTKTGRSICTSIVKINNGTSTKHDYIKMTWLTDTILDDMGCIAHEGATNPHIDIEVHKMMWIAVHRQIEVVKKLLGIEN